MRQHVREEQLALYAGGDLLPRENSAVAAHVEGCEECRKALAEFQEARSFVTSALRNPSIDELSAVHKRVAAELQAEKSNGKRWAWWMAGAAAVLALFFLPRGFEHKTVATRKVQPVAALPPVAERAVSRSVAEAPHPLKAVSRRKPLRSREAGIRTVTLISQADREPVMKLTTADPNIVILWQTNKGTGQEP